MNLTIIPSDGFVQKDSDGFSKLDLSTVPSDVHALQWDSNTSYGWIEYVYENGSKKPNDTITELPNWAVDCVNAWDEQNTKKTAQKQASDEFLIKECKTEAMYLLASTDWTQLPDVIDASKTPYLTNIDEFNDYRAKIRVFILNPVTNPVWPEVPKSVWVQ